MQNIEISKDGSILTVKIDVSKEFGPSKTGKTTIIASTQGNIEVGEGVVLGVNCYKRKSHL